MNRNLLYVASAIVVIVAIGVFATQFASSEPDGLEFVAEQEGFDDQAGTHSLEDAPLADYGANLDTSDGVGTATSALIGIAVTGAVVGGLMWVMRSGSKDPSQSH